MVAAWLATVTVLPALWARSTSASAPRAASPAGDRVLRAGRRASPRARRAAASSSLASSPSPRCCRCGAICTIRSSTTSATCATGAAWSRARRCSRARRSDLRQDADAGRRHRRPARARRRDPQEDPRSRHARCPGAQLIGEVTHARRFSARRRWPRSAQAGACSPNCARSSTRPRRSSPTTMCAPICRSYARPTTSPPSVTTICRSR